MLVVDRAQALERVEGDVELFRELVQIFLEDLPVRLTEIRTALERRDAPGLRSGAHSLKGASANLSALRVAEAARRLEQAGNDQDFNVASDVYAALVPEIDSLVAELAEFA